MTVLKQNCPAGNVQIGGLAQQFRETHYSRIPSSLQAINKCNSVISERVIEHEVKVPKRVVREEVVEKVIVVPERVVREHVVEELQKVREKIIEIAKPVVKEKIVEVPDIVYVEKVIEVPEKLYQEKLKEVPIVTYEERVIRLPKLIKQEKVVEIPELEYREVPIEKVIEVPEIREQLVIKEVSVPQYVEKSIPQYVEVEVRDHIVRHIPVPVEATTTFEYKMPQLKAKYNTVELNLYVPRFIEVPIPIELMDTTTIAQAEKYMHQVSELAAQTAVSLCEVENVAGMIKQSGIAQIVQNGVYQSGFTKAWKEGKIHVEDRGISAQSHYSHRSTTGAPMTDQSFKSKCRTHHKTKSDKRCHHRHRSHKF